MASQETGLVEVAPGIWAVIMSILPPEGGGPNAGFILSGDKVLVIDSLMSPGTGRQLKKHLSEVTENSPTYLINTHHHGDHVFGNEVFSPPAAIVAHENVRIFLQTNGTAMVKSFTERRSDLVPDIKDTKITLPQITYRESMTLHFGERTVRLIYTDVAHTNGDTIVYLPDDRILFAGDILFNHIFPPIFGSSSGWIQAIERVEAMDIETIIPGHGYIATKKELGDLKQCLIDLRSQVKDCFVRGLSKEQTVNEIDIPYLQWPHPDRLAQGVETIYKELMEEDSEKTS